MSSMTLQTWKLGLGSQGVVQKVSVFTVMLQTVAGRAIASNHLLHGVCLKKEGNQAAWVQPSRMGAKTLV